MDVKVQAKPGQRGREAQGQVTAVLAGVPSSGMRTAVGPGGGLISHLAPGRQHIHGAVGSWPSVLSMLCEEQVSIPPPAVGTMNNPGPEQASDLP